MLYKISQLTDELLDLIKDDPVRPEIPAEQRVNETASVFWHYDYGNQNYIRACRALLPESPRTAWYGYLAPPD